LSDLGSEPPLLEQLASAGNPFPSAQADYTSGKHSSHQLQLQGNHASSDLKLRIYGKRYSLEVLVL
jgi:hypothetical protein